MLCPFKSYEVSLFKVRSKFAQSENDRQGSTNLGRDDRRSSSVVVRVLGLGSSSSSS